MGCPSGEQRSRRYLEAYRNGEKILGKTLEHQETKERQMLENRMAYGARYAPHEESLKDFKMTNTKPYIYMRLKKKEFNKSIYMIKINSLIEVDVRINNKVHKAYKEQQFDHNSVPIHCYQTNDKNLFLLQKKSVKVAKAVNPKKDQRWS
jgi:hypothetical protein